MTTSVATDKERYLSDFRAAETVYPAGNGQTWLHRVRTDALSRFLELGFPTARRGNEKWKYTSVGPIAKSAFDYSVEAAPNGVPAAELQKAAPWHSSWTNLVFVNGRFSEALSTASPGSDRVHVGSLAEAEAIVATDPLVTMQASDLTVHEWNTR